MIYQWIILHNYVSFCWVQGPLIFKQLGSWLLLIHSCYGGCFTAVPLSVWVFKTSKILIQKLKVTVWVKDWMAVWLF